jgi:hypothetical protein
MLSRYILFLQNFSYQPKDALSLKIKARALASQNEMIIRDTRVSKSYIEYDISIPDKREVREVANIFRDIGAYASSYHVVDRIREKKEGVTEAITFFNEEKYWIAHEILESIWKGSRGVEKELLGLCCFCPLPKGRRGNLYFYSHKGPQQIKKCQRAILSNGC